MLPGFGTDPNLLSSDFHRIRGNWENGGKSGRFAGLNIKSGAVARTLDFAFVQLALAKRAIVVRAKVGHRVKFPFVIADNNALPGYIYDLNGLRRNLCNRSNFNELVAHSITSTR
jgi:hypothetical protein